MNPAKQQIWSLTKDLDLINRCKAAIRLDPEHPDYWPFVLMEVEQALKPQNRAKKASGVRMTAEQQHRYIKAYHAYQALKFPGWVSDGHTIDPRHCDTGTANGLTNFIVNYINWTGGNATRVSSEGKAIVKQGEVIRIPSSTRNGTADVTSTVKGRSVKFEVKVKRDRPSPAQLKEQDRERRAGGEYFFTHNVEEFFQQYDSLCKQKELF